MDDTTLSRIKTILAEQLGLDESTITEESNIRELGSDSLDDVEIIMSAEEEFNIEIDDDTAEKIVTVADAVKAVDELLA